MKKIHLIFIAIGLIAVTSYSSALYARGSTVTLCANTKSGALRYIKSGNCRSTENKIELDQNGELGQTGPQGPAGPAGADGSNGADGSSALSLYLQDSVGTKFALTGPYILWNGLVWNYGWSPNSTGSHIAGAFPPFYKDASCTLPIFGGSGWTKNDGVQATYITTTDHSFTGPIQSGWKRTGPLIPVDRAANYYYWQANTCNAQTGAISIDTRDFSDYYEAQPISWPVIVPPIILAQG
jgi:hypothetical protein